MFLTRVCLGNGLRLFVFSVDAAWNGYISMFLDE
jgi:hypothetical protein